MRSSQLLTVIVALGLVIAGFFALDGGGIFDDGQGAAAWSASDTSDTSDLEGGSGGLVGFGNVDDSPPESADADSGGGDDPSGFALAPNTEIFRAEDLGISFQYPKGIGISRFEEGIVGETILAQGRVGGIRGSAGFQIFVLPWDEGDGVITPERILQDVPDLVIDSPQEIVLADGKHALLFFSESEGLGKTREVWLIHRERLYQISTVASLDPWLASVMSTWRFQ